MPRLLFVLCFCRCPAFALYAYALIRNPISTRIPRGKATPLDHGQTVFCFLAKSTSLCIRLQPVIRIAYKQQMRIHRSIQQGENRKKPPACASRNTGGRSSIFDSLYCAVHGEGALIFSVAYWSYTQEPISTLSRGGLLGDLFLSYPSYETHCVS